MILRPAIERVYRHASLFCGLGAGAKGWSAAKSTVLGMTARWECAGGVDNDEGALRNFHRLTGVPGTKLDLFSLEQYRQYHGRDPEPGWREATPADLRQVFGRVDAALTSPPCKGYSGLLAQEKSATPKYQALNALTLRGIWLLLEAYKDAPIRVIVLENVPRIATRGRYFLDQIIALLHAYGYSCNEDAHDCGVVGGLAQSRKRYLLIARHTELVPPFIYQPPKLRLRGVGEVIGQLPMPGDPAAGPMHRVPSLQFKTWVRLAFVEAGSDWRSLNKLAVENGVLRDFGLIAGPPLRENAYGVCRWEDRGPLVTGARAPGQGRFSVADPRAQTSREGTGYLGVNAWSGHVGTVSGRGGVTNGGYSVADPRPGYKAATHTNLLSVVAFDDTSRVVSGAVHVAGGALSVADPRYRPRDRDGTLGVLAWRSSSGVVASRSGPTNGVFSIADPRPPFGATVHLTLAAPLLDRTAPQPQPAIPVDDLRIDGHPSSVQLGVRRWEQPAGVVTANMWIGAGRNAVADPRSTTRAPRYATYRIVALTDAPAALAQSDTPAPQRLGDLRAPPGRHASGKYRLTRYDAPSNSVIGASTTGNGAFAVADPTYAEHSLGRHANKMRVVAGGATAPTVTGSDRVGSGALSVADPRPQGLADSRRWAHSYNSQAHYGVMGWETTSLAVPGFAKYDRGRWSIADPRIETRPGSRSRLPDPDERLIARIIALDGTWHRPFTTTELASLQGLIDPADFTAAADCRRAAHDGLGALRPGDLEPIIDLVDGSDAKKREWIGNAIPPPSAKAIAETVGETLLLADAGERLIVSNRDIWVRPGALALAIENRQGAIDLDGADLSDIGGLA